MANHSPSLVGFSLVFFVVILTGYLLMVAQTFFLPLVIAFVISSIIMAIAEGICGISFRGWVVPSWLAYLFSLFFLLGMIVGLATFLSSNIAQLVAAAPAYQEKLVALVTKVSSAIGLEKSLDFSPYFHDFDFVNFVTQLARMLTDFAGSAGLIALYVIFLLLEQSFFEKKLNALLVKEKDRSVAHTMIDKIVSKMQKYLWIKTAMSFLTALLSYVVMGGVGLDFANFWALLIFLLNFIPTIGSLVATILPCMLSLVQFDSFTPFIVMSLGLIAIQFMVGNILEPRVMGRSFNLSGFIIILSLVIWGQIWGIVGMFLCVPIMVILMIIFENFSSTRPLAILLSQDGSLNVNPDK